MPHHAGFIVAILNFVTMEIQGHHGRYLFLIKYQIIASPLLRVYGMSH